MKATAGDRGAHHRPGSGQDHHDAEPGVPGTELAERVGHTDAQNVLAAMAHIPNPTAMPRSNGDDATASQPSRRSRGTDPPRPSAGFPPGIAPLALGRVNISVPRHQQHGRVCGERRKLAQREQQPAQRPADELVGNDLAQARPSRRPTRWGAQSRRRSLVCTPGGAGGAGVDQSVAAGLLRGQDPPVAHVAGNHVHGPPARRRDALLQPP